LDRGIVTKSSAATGRLRQMTTAVEASPGQEANPGAGIDSDRRLDFVMNDFNPVHTLGGIL